MKADKETSDSQQSKLHTFEEHHINHLIHKDKLRIMASKISSLSRFVNPLKLLKQTNFKKLNQSFLLKLITPLEDRIHIFGSRIIKTDLFLEISSIPMISEKYLNINLQNIPRLTRVDSLRWLQFFTIDPPLL
jgi:hypothetical protein